MTEFEGEGERVNSRYGTKDSNVQNCLSPCVPRCQCKSEHLMAGTGHE